MPTTPYEKIHGMYGDIYALLPNPVKMLGINSWTLDIEVSSVDIVDFSNAIDGQGNVWEEVVKGPARASVSASGYFTVAEILGAAHNIAAAGIYPGQGWNYLSSANYGLDLYILKPGLINANHPGFGYRNLPVLITGFDIEINAEANEVVTVSFEGKLHGYAPQGPLNLMMPT